MSLVIEAWDMDFDFFSAYLLHPSHPLPVPLLLPLLTFPQLVQDCAHCWTVASVASACHRRPVMTGKGSEIAQGQRCRPGLERLLFGLCLLRQIL